MTWLEESELYLDKLYERYSLLNENKDHLINRLNLSDVEKQKVIDFFHKYPNYENKIDWNRKDLTFKDFEPLLGNAGKSKTQAKKVGLSGITEGKDYIVLEDHRPDWIAYQPLTHLGSRILASNKVPPEIWPESKMMNWDEEDGEVNEIGNKPGAKWCISMNKPNHWNSYVNNGIKFIFIFNFNAESDNEKKMAVAVYPNGQKEIFYANDTKGRVSENINVDSLISKLQDYPGPDYVELGYLVLNKETGRYDCSNPSKVNIKHLIKNGKFILPLGVWNGRFDCFKNELTSLEGAPQYVGDDFSCSGNQLTSLEGSPRYVNGNFSCSGNKLTSLKGAPQEVGGGFYCNNNKLISLEGAPQKVGGSFNCSYNQLTSLKGAPQKVGKWFSCSSNQLTSLEGCPKKVNGSFDCGFNKLTSLEGAPREVGKDFVCDVNPGYPFEGEREDLNII